MCSILITNKKCTDYLDANFYQRLRGPDRTSIEYVNDTVFLHNLLSITGEFTPQPLWRDGIRLLYNGEIYNYQEFGDFQSDGYAIIEAYARHQENFAKYLDGEFAVVIYDEKKELYTFTTDVFATKPLYFAAEGREYGFSTYESALKRLGFHSIQKVPANSTFIFDPKTQAIEKVAVVHEFNLEQYKLNYDGWINAFRESVKKRTTHGREKLFIGLSSGYDSGAISCILNSEGVEYAAYTVIGKEDAETIKSRFSSLKNGAISKQIQPNVQAISAIRKHLAEFVEDYYYKIYSSVGDYNEFGLELKQDQGATGMALICMAAKNDGRKVCLSGQGADEIISDYGFAGQRIYRHSNFGGLFPENLKDIYPWASFYGSTQESYLMKEEQVAGSFGIETRYPFLDTKVVQEYLNLSCALKNRRYKAPIAELFDSLRYPYKENQKIGFVVTS